MIRGRVDDRRRAWITLDVGNGNSAVQPVAAIVDTGFDSYLTMPPGIIRRLGLELDRQTIVILATGVRRRVNVWSGYIRWHDRLRPIEVLEAQGDPLVGMRLLEGSQLTIQSRVNGEVVIEELMSL